jgi:uncharacterized protein (UPF0264 family)
VPVPAEPPRRAMQALVSVRTAGEARQAAAAGVRMIDLKEPRDGALGALPAALLREITQALRADGCTAEISATIGDLPANHVADALQRVQATASCGVDVVKVGVWPGPSARALLAGLRGWARGQAVRVVPVLIADRGWDESLVLAACEPGLAAVMVDTQDKRSGSLLRLLAPAVLRRFVDAARERGRRAAIAGALQLDDLPQLHHLAPDFVGFRSAVCRGDRGGELCPQRLRQLVDAMP